MRIYAPPTFILLDFIIRRIYSRRTETNQLYTSRKFS